MTIHQYWFSYDISNDRERARVERCIARYGQRLQKSVFCCVLDARRFAKLRGELESIHCESGSIIFAAIADPLWENSIDNAVNSANENWAFTLNKR